MEWPSGSLGLVGDFASRIIPRSLAKLHLQDFRAFREGRFQGSKVNLALDVLPAVLPDSLACKSSPFESNSISASTNSQPSTCFPVPTPSPVPSRNSSTSNRGPTGAYSNTGAGTRNLPALPGCAKPSPPSTNKSSQATFL